MSKISLKTAHQLIKMHLPLLVLTGVVLFLARLNHSVLLLVLAAVLFGTAVVSQTIAETRIREIQMEALGRIFKLTSKKE